MAVLRQNALSWLLCLVSLCCANSLFLKGTANITTVGPDRSNWNTLLQHMKNSAQKTSNVFSKILLANIKARTKVGRSDDGVFLLQGDIQIDQNDVDKVTDSGHTGRKKRALMRDSTKLWQSPIYYELSPDLGVTAQFAIASAIKEWNDVVPCLKWIRQKVSTQQQGYLYFFKGDGCYSSVGRVSTHEQKISIGNGCEYHGIVVHEIAHAFGFWHEQSRPDRNNYVRIIWKNIIPKMVFNFYRNSDSEVDSRGKAYDYDSVMHYGPYAFSKFYKLPTIQSKTQGAKFGQRAKLSKIDREQAQLLYNCTNGSI